MRTIGIVKRFNNDKGCGFITPDYGQKVAPSRRFTLLSLHAVSSLRMLPSRSSPICPEVPHAHQPIRVTMTDTPGNDIEHARAERDRALDAQARFVFLARSSQILAESLNYERTLTTVAAMALPHLGACASWTWWRKVGSGVWL